MAADSALHWVLSHRARLAQLRRAVAGTRAAAALDALIDEIRSSSSRLPAPKRTPRPTQRRTRVAPASRTGSPTPAAARPVDIRHEAS